MPTCSHPESKHLQIYWSDNKPVNALSRNVEEDVWREGGSRQAKLSCSTGSFSTRTPSMQLFFSHKAAAPCSRIRRCQDPSLRQLSASVKGIGAESPCV